MGCDNIYLCFKPKVIRIVWSGSEDPHRHDWKFALFLLYIWYLWLQSMKSWHISGQKAKILFFVGENVLLGLSTVHLKIVFSEHHILFSSTFFLFIIINMYKKRDKGFLKGIIFYSIIIFNYKFYIFDRSGKSFANLKLNFFSPLLCLHHSYIY